MAPRKPRASGAFSGAMMRRQADLQQELSMKTQQEAAAAEELARLGLYAARQAFLQEKVNEQQNLDPEERDESGFYPEETPLEYVPYPEVDRDDGDEAEVVFKRIAIRKKPSPEGRCLGAACMGERLVVYEWDDSRTWRKIQYRLRGGVGGLVYAWVMMRHPELGTLVRGKDEVLQAPKQVICSCGAVFSDKGRFCSECGAPRPKEEEEDESAPVKQRPRGPWSSGSYQAAAQPRGIITQESHSIGGVPKDSKEPRAVADGNVVLLDQFALSYLALEEENPVEEDEINMVGEDGCVKATVKDIQMHCVDGAVTYEVVHKPFIAIRGTPSSDGKIVGTAVFGEHVDTFGWDHTGKWRRVYGKIQGKERHVTAWVLVHKEGVGSLLREVQEEETNLD